MTRSPPDSSVSSVDRRLGWAALVAVSVLSAVACFRKIWAADFWWQNRTGRLVLDSGWPSVDVFSYTAEGRPWIELRWLFCVVQYLVLEQLGVAGVLVLKWLAVALAFTLVTLPAVRRRQLPLAAMVLTLALLTSSSRLFVRPELTTYVMFALFVLVLDAHRKSGTRWIWILPILQVVWVNAHTLFLLGPLLVALLATVAVVALVLPPWRVWLPASNGEARFTVSLVGVLGATTLACLLNPYTYRGLLFPFRLFGEIRGESTFNQVIEEFQSPLLVSFSALEVRFWAALVGLVVLAAMVDVKRLDPFWTILCGSQLYLSTLALRNLPLFALAAVPFVLSQFGRAGGAERWRRFRSVWIGRAISLAAIVTCGWFTISIATDRFSLRQGATNGFGIGFAPHRFPVQAVEFVERSGVAGRIFSPMREGSYLISRDHPVFIDPRLEVYGEDWLRRYLLVQSDAAAFRRAVTDFDIRIVLVDLRSNSASLIHGRSEWALVHFDDVAAVYVRRDAAGGLAPIEDPDAFAQALGQVRRALPRPRPLSERGPLERVTLPDPYLAVADFLLMTGQPGLARPFLEDAQATALGIGGLDLRRATLAELEGDWAAVVRSAEAGLQEDPDDPRLQIKLGSALYRSGRTKEAKLWLERSLEARPDRATTWAQLGSIHAIDGSLEQAEASLSRAVELAPEQPAFVANLARVRARLGRTAEAIAGLEVALRLAPRDVGVLRDLALLQVQSGDFASARRSVEAGLRLDPAEPTLLQLQERMIRR